MYAQTQRLCILLLAVVPLKRHDGLTPFRHVLTHQTYAATCYRSNETQEHPDALTCICQAGVAWAVHSGAAGQAHDAHLRLHVILVHGCVDGRYSWQAAQGRVSACLCINSNSKVPCTMSASLTVRICCCTDSHNNALLLRQSQPVLAAEAVTRAPVAKVAC